MCANNNSRVERHDTHEYVALLQTSPASCDAIRYTSTSNFSGLSFVADSVPNINPQTKDANKCILRCFRKMNPILLSTCVFLSCLMVRYLLGSVTTAPIAEDNEIKSRVHEIFNYRLSRNVNARHDNAKKSRAHEVGDSGRSRNVTALHGNDFVNQFRNSIKSDSLALSAGHLNDGFIPFIVRNGKLLCRRVHRNKITQGTRIRAIAEMIHIGLELYKDENRAHTTRGELPFFLLNSDSNGCSIKRHRDNFDFPRFTWSYPSPKHGPGWCNAIPVPSYLSWKTFHKDHKSHSSWDVTFASQENNYPWSSKINKAVWRGSTTYDKHFSGAELDEIPRGKLVRKSMDNPELIDAGFFKLNQQYASREEELSNRTILTERIDFDDQMKYKAIIDIDGNNWSGRFPKLLCTNSVIVKIESDYIEYFYHELKPMIHYVPASIENVTQVAAYVNDKENEEEMKGIVASAQSFCKSKMTEGGMTKDAMAQLKKYEASLNEYMKYSTDSEPMTRLIPDGVVNDLVECR